MKILNGNTVYEFTVAQSDAALSVNADEIQIELRYRKFGSRSQSPCFEEERSIRLLRNQRSAQSVMTDVLQEFDVPEANRSDMAAHFSFYIDRLSRRNCNRGGSIHVTVCLDVKEISAERAAAIQRRIDAGRTEMGRDRRRLAVDAAPSSPAKKSVVESLERKRVAGQEEEKDCAICLEKLGVGEEVIVLPCFHVYHSDCIIRWLGRTHFCPFCRFMLPC